jgi:hypothetical protein
MKGFGGAVCVGLGLVSCLGAALGGEDEARRLERRWAQIEKTPPNLGVRELFAFALDAAALGWQPERITKALALAEQMQDRDEKSRTFGNFRWYWRAERPEDLNAVEFSMQQGVLAWKLHKKGSTRKGPSGSNV